MSLENRLAEGNFMGEAASSSTLAHRLPWGQPLQKVQHLKFPSKPLWHQGVQRLLAWSCLDRDKTGLCLHSHLRSLWFLCRVHSHDRNL